MTYTLRESMDRSNKHTSIDAPNVAAAIQQADRLQRFVDSVMTLSDPQGHTVAVKLGSSNWRRPNHAPAN